jgi:hypothetical protein
VEKMAQRFQQNRGEKAGAEGQMKEKFAATGEKSKKPGIVAVEMKPGDIVSDGIGGAVHGQVEQEHETESGVGQRELFLIQLVADNYLEQEISDGDKKIGGGKDDAALEQTPLGRGIARLGCGCIRAHDFACQFIEYEPIASLGAWLRRKRKLRKHLMSNGEIMSGARFSAGRLFHQNAIQSLITSTPTNHQS